MLNPPLRSLRRIIVTSTKLDSSPTLIKHNSVLQDKMARPESSDYFWSYRLHHLPPYADVYNDSAPDYVQNVVPADTVITITQPVAAVHPPIRPSEAAPPRYFPFVSSRAARRRTNPARPPGPRVCYGMIDIILYLVCAVGLGGLLVWALL